MRHTRFAAAAACLTVAAGGAAAYLSTQPAGSPPPRAVSPPAPRPDVLTALSGGAVPAHVPAALAALTDAPAFGSSLHGIVVDADSGQVVWARHPATPLPPASTVKLLTAVAALHTLGPQARLATDVARAGRTLYLVGGGDVTLTARPSLPPGTTGTGRAPSYPRPASLDVLAARTAAALAAGGGPPVGLRLRYDAGAWTGPAQAAGWNPGYLAAGDVSRLSPLEVDEARVRPGESARDPDPARQAAQAFAAALRRHGVATTGEPHPAPAPASALGVARVESPPVAALVQRMLTVSDNDLAESLGRQVAIRTGRPASFAGAAAAITTALADLGLPMSGIRLHDASGLSRLDRVSPRALVTVLRLVVTGESALRAVTQGLPVAGLTGTLDDRYRDKRVRRGAGVVRAKTGTLAGVSALAGQVADADGRLLLFAFLTDHAPSPTAAEVALDRLAARLARCGCS